MIHRDTYINKIRKMGYTYKTQQKRTDLWRKIGGIHFISVPRCDLLELDFVRSTLRQAGATTREIESFIASATS